MYSCTSPSSRFRSVLCEPAAKALAPLHVVDEIRQLAEMQPLSSARQNSFLRRYVPRGMIEVSCEHFG